MIVQEGGDIINFLVHENPRILGGCCDLRVCRSLTAGDPSCIRGWCQFEGPRLNAGGRVGASHGESHAR